MFCRNCGEKLSEGVKFCAKCGTSVDGSVQAVTTKMVSEDNNIKYALKPTFKLAYKLMGNFFYSLAMVAVLFMIVVSESYSFELIPVLAIIAVFFVIIYTAIKTIFDKKQYDELEYNFYNTKIEYKDGYLNKEEKELKYRYIREVTMSRSILERIFGIGTVNIFTNASSGGTGSNHGSMNSRNGIHIHCLENVEEEYRKIKQIIDEGTEE